MRTRCANAENLLEAIGWLVLFFLMTTDDLMKVSALIVSGIEGFDTKILS